MPATVVVGCQWGDEGKGKIVDVLAAQSHLVARYQGGPNAGHTVVINGKKSIFHILPSGILHEGVMNLIGNGVVVDPISLLKEIDGVEATGINVESRLRLSEQAHVILPLHKQLDAALEDARGEGKIGTTKRGIGLAYADKSRRQGIRLCDFRHRASFEKKYNVLASYHGQVIKFLSGATLDNLQEEMESVWQAGQRLLPMVCDGVMMVNDALDAGKNVLCEGAQGVLLDIDHGTYPFVTSSNPSPGGACTGLGIAPNKINRIIGIVKAYTTRVGEGPLPTELLGEAGETLRQRGGEFGATTGRARRCGWLDLPVLRRSIQISGCTDLCITKLDVLDDYPELPVCTHYEIGGERRSHLPFDLDELKQAKPVYETVKGWQSASCACDTQEALPGGAVHYLNKISSWLGTPITMVSTGPGREHTLDFKAGAA